MVIFQTPTAQLASNEPISMMPQGDVRPRLSHFYEGISGWFDFAPIYEQAVRNARAGAHFVEIGAWYGRSTAFMAVEILNSGKAIKFDVIDTWEGSVERQKGSANEDPNLVQYGTIYSHFLRNVRPALHAMVPIKMASLEAAALYEDHSLDFVFLDAAHDYDNVRADILAWRPKIKRGGIFAGHDYNRDDSPGLVQAVHECLGQVEFVPPRSWRVRV